MRKVLLRNYGRLNESSKDRYDRPLTGKVPRRLLNHSCSHWESHQGRATVFVWPGFTATR